MDNTYSNSTNNQLQSIGDQISLSGTGGIIRPTKRTNNFLLIGTWSLALFLTSSLYMQVPKLDENEIYTRLNFQNRTTQGGIDYSQGFNTQEDFDYECNSDYYPRLEAKNTYSIKIKITSIDKGKPVIEKDSEDYEI